MSDQDVLQQIQKYICEEYKPDEEGGDTREGFGGS